MLANHYEQYVELAASGDFSDAARFKEMHEFLADLGYDVEADILRAMRANELVQQINASISPQLEAATAHRVESLQSQRDALAAQEPSDTGDEPRLIWEQRLVMADDQLQAATLEMERARNLVQRATKAKNQLADVELMPRHWRKALERRLAEQSETRRELARIDRKLAAESTAINLAVAPRVDHLRAFCETDLTAMYTKAFAERKLRGQQPTDWELPE